MSDSTFSKRICDQLLEISSGSCSITEEMIRAEPNADLAAVLTGLTLLWEDLEYAAERRAVAEAELRKREARFRTLFDQARVSIWDCDLSDLLTELRALGPEALRRASPSEVRRLFAAANVLAVNTQTLASFDADSADTFLERRTSVVVDESTPMLTELFVGLVEGRQQLEAEGVLATLSGAELRVVVGISNASGEDCSQTIITVSDVTPIHRAREAASALAAIRTDELRRVNDEVERLFYAVSHDLRAPLRGVVNLAEWAIEDLNSGAHDEVRGHLSMLTERVARLETMMNDLLSFARVGRTEHALEQVDVAQLLEEIRDGLVNLPPGFELVWTEMPVISTQKTLLSQVLLNLVSNAIKHHDKVTGRIEVSHRRIGDEHEFSIADDGPGIPVKYRQKVFDMFSTLKPRDEVEGSGMGLAFVHKLITKRAGRLSVDDNPAGGATFSFTWREGDAPSHAPPALSA